MPSSRYAVLIGCNSYANLPPLRCSHNDVLDMGKVLSDPKIGGFDKITTFLKDEPSAHILPKLEEVITVTARSRDMIVVYFSGHGMQDRKGKLYLATRETKETALDTTSMAMERLMGYVDRSDCQTILMILDCCYSGAVKGVFSKGGVDGVLIDASQGRGLFIMTSSTDIQPSHEREAERNSIFTKYLVDGLRSGEADLHNSGRITADDAFSYTANLVRNTGLQDPRKFNVNVSGEIVLAKNCRYVPLKTPDPNELSEEDFKKFFAVKNMIDLLQVQPPPVFMIMLFNYYIEGEMYRTTGLTVSPGHTPNIRQTATGFECDTFFKPEMITPPGRAGKEVINGRVKVRMRVDLKDIMLIVGKLKEGQGRQVQFYPAESGGEVTFLTGPGT